MDGGKRTASLLRSDADIVSADGTLIFPLLPMNAGGRIMPAGLIRFFGKSSVPGEEVAVFERRRLHLLSRRSRSGHKEIVPSNPAGIAPRRH